MKRIKTSIKFLLIFFSIISFLTIITAALLFYYFPEEKLLNIISENIEQRINKNVSIESINYSLRGLSLSNITLTDIENGDVFFSADKVELSFSLKKLLQKEIKLNKLYIYSPSIKLTYYNNVFNINNLLKKNEPVKNKKDASKIQVNIPEMSIYEGNVSFETDSEKFMFLEGNYKISTDLVTNLGSKNIIINNSKVSLPSSRGELSLNTKIDYSNNNIIINSDITTEKFTLEWLFKNPAKSPVPFKTFEGHIKSLFVDIKQKYFSCSFDGNSHIADNKIFTGTGNAHYNFENNTITLSEIKANLDKSKYNISKMMIYLKSSKVHFSANSFYSTFADLRYFVNLPPKLYGTVSGSLYYYNKISANLSLNAGWDYNNKTISDFKTDIEIKDNKFKEEKIPFKIMGTPAQISIAAAGENFDKFITYLYIDNFDFTNNESTSTSSPPKSSNISINIPVDVSGKVYINKLKVKKYTFTKNFISFTAHKNFVNFNKLVSNFEGSTIQGNGNIILTGTPVLNIYTNFNNLKIQNLSKYFIEFDKRFFGTANGKLSLSIPLNGDASALKGKIIFSIRNGKLVDTGLQGALGLFLEPLKYKLKDLEFNTVYGNFDIFGNNYRINSFVFNSNDFRISMNGQMNRNLISDTSIRVEFNEAFIKDIPNLAYLQLNKYKTGLWYTLTIDQEGDITKSNSFRINK